MKKEINCDALLERSKQQYWHTQLFRFWKPLILVLELILHRAKNWDVFYTTFSFAAMNLFCKHVYAFFDLLECPDFQLIAGIDEEHMEFAQKSGGKLKWCPVAGSDPKLTSIADLLYSVTTEILPDLLLFCPHRLTKKSKQCVNSVFYFHDNNKNNSIIYCIGRFIRIRKGFEEIEHALNELKDLVISSGLQPYSE